MDVIHFLNTFSEDPYLDNQYFTLDETQLILQHPKYDPNKKTLLYCYGYTETFRSKSTITVVQAYIKRGDHNIIVLDWEDYCHGHYIQNAVPQVYTVSDAISKSLLKMEKQGLDFNKLHVVGHSLGDFKFPIKFEKN